MSKLEANDQEKKIKNPEQGRIDYATTAFMLKQPCSSIITKGPIRLANRDAHRELLETAKKSKLYVWHATVVLNEETKRYVVSHLHLIDWESIPDQAYGNTEPLKPSIHTVASSTPDDLVCSTCGHQCSSRSGYTLHMKKHWADKEKAEEAVDSGNQALVCPVCQKLCSSTSGLTLHKKNAHPECSKV